MQRIEIGPFITHIIDNFQSIAIQRESEILLQTQDSPIFLWADPDKLESILFNLITNAFKYSPKGTVIHLSTKETDTPQILIYHSHSQETFADSRPGERADTVIGLGDDLQELLEKQYGYEVLHITEAFDMKEGCLERSRAYNYAEPVIAAALEEHPSIQVVIDLHRDGVNGSKRLVTEINGKPTAQIMFFNGLSRTKESGELTSLPNPYQAENLAFSFQMEYEAEQYYPGFFTLYLF